MKKILKIIFVPILSLVFMTGCENIIPYIPVNPDPVEPENPGEEVKTICGFAADYKTYGNLETSVMLSASAFHNTKSSTVKIAACYEVNSKEVTKNASGFIFDKSFNETTHTYTYYICSSSSGVFYRYITNTDGEFSIENNTKVIREGAFELCFEDGHRYLGDLVGYYDPYDVAVFKFESKDEYDVYELGDSDDLYIGQDIYICGTPEYGFDLFNTLVKGYVSGLNRNTSVNFFETYNSKLYGASITTYPSFQFDASINEGMQGGPVLNNLGQVIGMCGYRYNDGDGIYESVSFGVGINDLKLMLNTIKSGKEFVKPTIGVYVTDIFNVSTSTSASWLHTYHLYQGAYIVDGTGIVSGGKAEQAGMTTNMLIIKLTNDDKEYEIINIASLSSALVRVDKSKPVYITALDNQNVEHIFTFIYED